MAANPFVEMLAAKVGADPVTAAITAAVTEGVRAGLQTAGLPRLAFTRDEVCELLGVSGKTVADLIADGRLRLIGAGPKARVSIGSVLELVEYPMAPAPVSDPGAAVPQLAAVKAAR
jgi:excisionase family DNA binding protein